MPDRPPYLRLALLALAAAGCFDTKPTEVTGGGGVETTEGNLALVGISLSGPAGARVSLIPADFDPLRDTLPDSLTAIADANGRYSFRGLATGRYNLEAYHPSAGTRCFRPGVVITKGDRAIPGMDTLAAPGRLRLTWDGAQTGVLTQIGRTFRLELAGLEPDSGGITLDSLPSGLLPPITFTPAVDSAPRLWTDSVRIEPGRVASVPVLGTWAHSALLNWYAPSAPVDGLEGYPLLVRLARPAFPFEEVPADGSGIRFTSQEGDPLPHAVETWDSAAGKAEIWVRLEARPGGGFGSLRMDWGGASPGIPAGSVFDSAVGFAGVWHLARAGTDPGGRTDDSGPFALRTAAVDLAALPLGVIGGAQRFDGIGSHVSAAGAAPVQRPSLLFASAWIAPDTTGIPPGTPARDRTILSKWDAADSAGFMLVYYPHFNGVRLIMGFGTKTEHLDAELPRDSVDAWHLLAATYDGNEAAIWWDGKELLRWTFGPGNLAGNARDILIGARASADPDSGAVDGFRGGIDEARVLLSVPPKEWLELDYQTQKPGADIFGFQRLK